MQRVFRQKELYILGNDLFISRRYYYLLSRPPICSHHGIIPKRHIPDEETLWIMHQSQQSIQFYGPIRVEFQSQKPIKTFALMQSLVATDSIFSQLLFMVESRKKLQILAIVLCNKSSFDKASVNRNTTL